MENTKFKELFQRVVEQYALSPDAANELLQRILSALGDAENIPLQTDAQYEMLMEYLERE